MAIYKYIKEIKSKYQQGNTTEHSFRGVLEILLKSLTPEISVMNEPKRIACGAPDYILMRENIPIGYIEAKNIGDNDLEGKKKNKEQFDRYKHSLSNIIFTDYLNFYFYRDGKVIQQISIASLENNIIKERFEHFEQFENLIKDFCLYIGQTLKNPNELAKIMAGKAKLLANIIANALESDEKSLDNSSLEAQYKAFKTILIHDINVRGFADVYAQTVTYGLFSARLNDKSLDTFSREEASKLIPKSNPFLKKLFSYISGVEFDERIEWVVGDLVQVFLASNVKTILLSYGKSTQTEDPIIHFYETFLAEYDPALRKARGVWYTPTPVVDFIVGSVDEILKSEFSLPNGLAYTGKTKIEIELPSSDKRRKDGKVRIEKEIHKVQILDPATGTGTFLAQVVKQIHKKFKGQQGIWSSYVDQDLIPRLHGFEILMASYAMAHLKIDLLLEETGYQRKSDQRLGVYLTNSLEEYHSDTGTLFASWLSDEANEANRIKKEMPVMCVLGNPPYSGESANKGDWIMGLMEDYKKEPDSQEKLKEKNPKWINDDYVKFIRYGQHYIEKNGSGILAYINPHGFLDNPTFRGMRWNLLKTYDKIYIIDLHGNSNRAETALDGSVDQNVFDIKQGVSINLFVKTGKKKKGTLAQVFHYDLYGKRHEKYEFLNSHSLNEIKFQLIPAKAPMYFMANRNFDLEEEYQQNFSIQELFPLNNVGMVTARDGFTIHNNLERVKAVIESFLSIDDEMAREKYKLGQDVRDWKVSFARSDLEQNYPKLGVFRKISYRLFDDRWTYYTGKSKGFHCYPRNEVMQHFFKEGNIGLTLCKQFKAGKTYQHVFITKQIIESSFVSNKTSEITSVFPLYLYHNKQQGDMIDENTRTPNLNTEIVSKIAYILQAVFTPEKETTKNTFAPIDILDYIYAVLHSCDYREKYKEFLRMEFPRVPYPNSYAQFCQLVVLGKQIRELHLLESSLLDELSTIYPNVGSNEVDKPEYREGKVWINASQYFGNIPEIAWEFYIGGYQPAQKWLKDRKGKVLSFEDIIHYQKIIMSLAETHQVMLEIDKVIQK